MKAMILAAGRGVRMRPLTDHTPKPLLEVGGKPLIVHHIEALRGAGHREIVVNLAHLGSKIKELLAGGRRLGVRIAYSVEPEGALEVGGGIRHALPLLGPDAFIVVNGDVWTDLDLGSLPAEPQGLAHLVLADNPPHHPGGDFGLRGGVVTLAAAERLTYAGVAVMRPSLFRGWGPGRYPLLPVLRPAIASGEVSGQHHAGRWRDIGTPERLEGVRSEAARRASKPV